jgi:hypothetical protein
MLVQVLILIKIKLNKNVIFKSKMVRASAYFLLQDYFLLQALRKLW